MALFAQQSCRSGSAYILQIRGSGSGSEFFVDPDADLGPELKNCYFSTVSSKYQG